MEIKTLKSVGDKGFCLYDNQIVDAEIKEVKTKTSHYSNTGVFTDVEYDIYINNKKYVKCFHETEEGKIKMAIQQCYFCDTEKEIIHLLTKENL